MSAPHGPFSVDSLKVVVTGASSGLGAHFARLLAARGAEVFCCARRGDKLRDLVAEIRSLRGRAHALTLDVTDRISVRAAFDAIGTPDVLVNNAGITEMKRVLDFGDESWNAIVATNLGGAWRVAQEGARAMIEARRPGSIINVTSILASRVVGGLSPYLAAKAALKHLTQSMALELARNDIRVNSIAPGYVVTDINRSFLESEAGRRLRQRIPSRRFCLPQDLDGALLLLASSASAHMTGSEIVVDGGHLCAGI